MKSTIIFSLCLFTATCSFSQNNWYEVIVPSGKGFHLGSENTSGSVKMTATSNVFTGGRIVLNSDAGNPIVSIQSSILGADYGHLTLNDASSSSSISLSANYALSGDSRIITDEIEIRGGSDLSEHFDISHHKAEMIQPGMLVSIDPNVPGKLKLCSEPYDKKVVGVISGANGIKPGMMMGQINSIAHGEYPVALTGRVYVYVDADYEKIEPGDLLTSSRTLGYAMKAKKKRKSQGAIIGKAMTGLESGKGYVLVLVNLQ